MGQICKANKIPHTLLDKGETFVYSDPVETEEEVAKAKPTHIAIVHSETTRSARCWARLYSCFFPCLVSQRRDQQRGGIC